MIEIFFLNWYWSFGVIWGILAALQPNPPHTHLLYLDLTGCPGSEPGGMKAIAWTLLQPSHSAYKGNIKAAFASKRIFEQAARTGALVPQPSHFTCWMLNLMNLKKALENSTLAAFRSACQIADVWSAENLPNEGAMRAWLLTHAGRCPLLDQSAHLCLLPIPFSPPAALTPPPIPLRTHHRDALSQGFGWVMWWRQQLQPVSRAHRERRVSPGSPASAFSATGPGWKQWRNSSIGRTQKVREGGGLWYQNTDFHERMINI